MNCIQCNGTGRVREHRKADKQCYDCKGTGLAVQAIDSSMHYDGATYAVDIVLPYINTRKKKCFCKVMSYEVSMAYMQQTGTYPFNYYPLKDVLFVGADTITGAQVCRPLWRSVKLKRINELFDTHIAERK